MLIPAEQRFPDLKGKLGLFANATHAVIAKFPSFDAITQTATDSQPGTLNRRA
jgi:hypothetical protein